MKIARLVAVTLFAFTLLLSAQSSLHADSATKLPEGWDPNIPLPAGVVLQSSTVPKTGVVYSADFTVKGDFKELMDFYETNLPKAGFQMSSKVAMPARKVYNRNFARGGRLDSVVVTPSTSDPSAFNLHFAWSPQAPIAKASPAS